ncbi:MAG TPA: hypothetical protein PK052_04905 [Anaerohalosphaeraceae bacterium]|nr:hypothetical protein [Anaerohalosphaeraceae bacterium]HOL31301.1 hypothetical protein [Anaerohalosphaeraceae bacterium]HOM76965.1 hypothetical protein [Anaerohalosphaeraceae bacterium]HPC64755.1 hypothetical protein [Anaerohalosphaeraceae bacterium]HRS71809.1 hypothetical protein [Anaerohalosphaeraceae bacterium]
MGDSLKKVTSGDPLRIPAQAYNLFIDTARQYLASKQNAGVRPHPASVNDTRVLVKNNSGADCAQFAVLGIDGIIFDPADALEAFKQQVVVSGTTPSSTTHSDGRFVILNEPIVAGNLGYGWIVGVCQVQVNVTSESHRYADITNGSSASLVSADAGPCVILWKPLGTGLLWSIVRLGASGSGLHIAFAKTDAGAANSIDCYLDTNGTGPVVTVTCPICGGSALNLAFPRLAIGDPITVWHDGTIWRSVMTFQAADEDCQDV